MTGGPSRILLVRPGFSTGRMTGGLPPAPLATTPEAVEAAAALRRGQAILLRPPEPTPRARNERRGMEAQRRETGRRVG